MSSFIRRMRIRGLKRQGYHREGPYRWAILGGKPTPIKLKKSERRVMDPDGNPVGMHYPR